MAENKKISELNQIQNLSDNDEFVIVDKSTTSGTDASSTGKTAKATLWQLKDAISASGEKGQKGQPGQDGDTGLPGKDGNDGPRGYKGDRGDRGYKGETGQKGFMGGEGPRGYKGQRGEAGMPGAPGDPGIPGNRGYKGDPGDPGATGFKGQKGEGGESGNSGPAGDPGKSGDKGIKGSAGRSGKDGNANAHHDWIGRNLGSDGSGQRLIKTLATNSWSSGYGYTKLQFTGACSLIFSPHSAPDIFCFGIVSSPISSTSDGRDNVRIGWSFDGNGNAKLWFNKKEHPDHAKKYSENDIFEVRYDGNYVRWFFNGSYVSTIQVGYQKFGAGIAIHSASATVTSSYSFSAAGMRGPMGKQGDKGEPGSGSAGPGGQGPAGEKGQKGASITGTPGSDGAKGEKGLPGGEAAKGEKGPTGASGDPWGGGSFTGAVTFKEDITTEKDASFKRLEIRDGGGKNILMSDQGILLSDPLTFHNDTTGNTFQLRASPSKNQMLYWCMQEKDSNHAFMNNIVAYHDINVSKNLWVSGETHCNYITGTQLLLKKGNNEHEGGEIWFQRPSSEGDTTEMLILDTVDYKVAGRRKVFRFFDHPYQKVFAEICESSTYINGKLSVEGDLEVKGNAPYVDWNAFAFITFNSTIQYKVRSGMFLKRYHYVYYNGDKADGSWGKMGNGALTTYYLHSSVNRNGVAPAGVIKDSNKYVAKCANVANVPMNAKISYKFSSNTDDGVGYGVWVAFADYTAIYNDSLFNAYTAEWTEIQKVEYPRSPGNRVRLDETKEVTIPAKKAMFVRVMGQIRWGSDQYESVSMDNIEIHSPVWPDLSHIK